MSGWSFWLIVGLWSLVIVFGGSVAYYAFRSWRTSRSSSMLALGSGLFLVSAAVGSMWLWFYFTSDNYLVANVTCTGITAAGFALILYALRGGLS